MQIHFWPQEQELMRKAANRYREKTGDNYSMWHVMDILKNKYERNLEKDLDEVMDIKIREYEEGLAEKGVKM